MKLTEGKLVMETVKCWDCDGVGKRTRHTLCPNWNKPVKPAPKCQHCGSKNRHSHQTVGTYLEHCTTCDGKGQRLEDRYSEWSHVWKELPLRVIRQNREQSWNEQHIGAGCLFSCVDYGAAWKQSDDEVLSEIKANAGGEQACKFSREDLTLPEYIGIFVTPSGYSVRAVFNILDTASNIARERTSEQVHALHAKLGDMPLMALAMR